MSRGRRRVALLILAVGTLPVPLDTSVNISLPSLSIAHGLDLQGLKWIVIAYVLTYSSLMLVLGRVGDIVGYRRVFQVGLLISVIGLTACGLAPDAASLYGARAVQGVGTALTLACGPALVISLGSERERVRLLAFYAAVMATGSALGPILGGLALEHWGWQGIFHGRAPLAALALLASPLLPATRPSVPGGRLDLLGALLTMAAMALVSLSLGGALGAATPLVALLALVVVPGWWWQARRSRAPILDPAYLARPSFAALAAAGIAIHLASFAILIVVPFFIVVTAGHAGWRGGLILATSGLGAVAGSWLAGRISPRIGAGRTALAGLALAGLGLAAIAFWHAGTPAPLLMGMLCAQGLGLGLFQVAASDIVTAELPRSARGVAGSLVMVTRTIGVVAGASLLAGLHGSLAATCIRGLQLEGCRDGIGGAPFGLTMLAAGLGLLLFTLATLLVPGAWRQRTQQA